MKKIKMKKAKKDLDKTKKIKKAKKQEPSKKEDKMDVVLEQIEKPKTTTHCAESVPEEKLGDVKKFPDAYLEVNMINKNRMVDNFYIKNSLKSFKYKDSRYRVMEKRIYLLPEKSGFFMLTSFYIEGSRDPKQFENTNKGITSKAFTLLYKEELYEDLFAPDEAKYNFIIAVFLVANFALLCASLYLLYRGGHI